MGVTFDNDVQDVELGLSAFAEQREHHEEDEHQEEVRASSSSSSRGGDHPAAAAAAAPAPAEAAAPGAAEGEEQQAAAADEEQRGGGGGGPSEAAACEEEEAQKATCEVEAHVPDVLRNDETVIAAAQEPDELAEAACRRAAPEMSDARSLEAATPVAQEADESCGEPQLPSSANPFSTEEVAGASEAGSSQFASHNMHSESAEDNGEDGIRAASEDSSSLCLSWRSVPVALARPPELDGSPRSESSVGDPSLTWPLNGSLNISARGVESPVVRVGVCGRNADLEIRSCFQVPEAEAGGGAAAAMRAAASAAVLQQADGLPAPAGPPPYVPTLDRTPRRRNGSSLSELGSAGSASAWRPGSTDTSESEWAPPPSPEATAFVPRRFEARTFARAASKGKPQAEDLPHHTTSAPTFAVVPVQAICYTDDISTVGPGLDFAVVKEEGATAAVSFAVPRALSAPAAPAKTTRFFFEAPLGSEDEDGTGSESSSSLRPLLSKRERARAAEEPEKPAAPDRSGAPSKPLLREEVARTLSDVSELDIGSVGGSDGGISPPRAFVTWRGRAEWRSDAVLLSEAHGHQVAGGNNRSLAIWGAALSQVGIMLNHVLGGWTRAGREALDRVGTLGRETLESWAEQADDLRPWMGEQMSVLQAGFEASLDMAMSNAALCREKAKAKILDYSAPVRREWLTNLKDMIKTSALADPDMWGITRDCLSVTLDRFLEDIEREIEVSLEAALLKQHENSITEGPSARYLPVACYYKARAFLLHHYLPHDRSIYGKLYDPVYLAIMMVTLAPIHLIRVLFFSIILCMLVIPSPPDEFQLVNFILLFKGTQFLNAGLFTALKGSMQYFLCFTMCKEDLLHCISEYGPGGKERLLPGLVDYLGSCVLVWIAFRALPYSQKCVKPRYVGRPLYEEKEEDDEEEELASCCGISYRVTRTKGGRLGQLLWYDVKCFALSIITLVVLGIWSWSIDLQDPGGALAWLNSSPQFKEDLFWCKVLYGLLSLPFLPYSISFLCRVLTHCEWTGYNENGACVAFELPPGGSRRHAVRPISRVRRAFVSAVCKYGRHRAPVPC